MSFASLCAICRNISHISHITQTQVLQLGVLIEEGSNGSVDWVVIESRGQWTHLRSMSVGMLSIKIILQVSLAARIWKDRL